MSLMVDDVKALKPDWKQRRPVIKRLILFMSVLIVAAFGSSIWLAAIGKFGFYISMFFITQHIIAFALIIGLVSAWIFGNRFETKDYFDLIKNIAPNTKHKDETEE